jgi:hypothetical protein
MSEANPTLDPIGYRCDGCGRLFQDPYADLSAIRAAGGMSCCPERKPVGLSDRIKELEKQNASLEAKLNKLRAVSERALMLSLKYSHFKLHAMEPMHKAIAAAKTKGEKDD